MSERLLIAVLATTGATWAARVTRWSTDGTLPVEVRNCVSADELRATLDGPRRVAAVLIDARAHGLDRDLVARARALGAPIIVSAEQEPPHQLPEVDLVLHGPLDRERLAAAVAELSTPAVASTAVTELDPVDDAAHPTGRFLVVVGTGGVGATTLTSAIGRALASAGHDLCVADLTLRADLGVVHDAADVVPGLQELVEAHGVSSPLPAELDRFTWDAPEWGYRLLLGLRRPTDWTALRPAGIDAALAGLRARHQVLVAEVDSQLSGRLETGSADIEDRHHLARSAVGSADAVAIVGRPTVTGLHGLARLVASALDTDLELEPARLLPVVIGGPRSAARRAEIAQVLAELIRARTDRPAELASPLHLPFRRDAEREILAGRPVPLSAGRSAADALWRMSASPRNPPRIEPMPVDLGTLGTLRTPDITEIVDLPD